MPEWLIWTLVGSVGIKLADYVVRLTPNPHDDAILAIVKETFGQIAKARTAKGSKPGGQK